MLCHRYPTMGRFDKDGEKKVFYVSGEGYKESVHGGFRCTACHLGLDKIPHTDIKKVDCSMKCHLENVSRKKEFSHIEVVKKFETSVHGKGKSKESIAFPDDLPTCKYCHDNRGYYSRSKKEGEAATAYRHMEGQLRSQGDVIELCASCHEDQEKMSRHGLESIETYKDTFHWKALQYGVANAPDCISCHVPIGFSLHTVRSKKDPRSSIHKNNRVKTCSNPGGLQTCHPDATPEFASGRVHEYGIKAQLAAGESDVIAVESPESVIVEEAEDGVSEKEQFQYKVLGIIRLFYKILIGFTIGFMSLHQLLDFIRARKKQKDLKGFK